MLSACDIPASKAWVPVPALLDLETHSLESRPWDFPNTEMGRVEKRGRKNKTGETQAKYFKTTCRILGLLPNVHHFLHQDAETGRVSGELEDGKKDRGPQIPYSRITAYGPLLPLKPTSRSLQQ